ncbi:hypothetical protein L7F22_014333 [Adiantum nelumboides]|nr:hypothetical protein [Adiantum nelumboides]
MTPTFWIGFNPHSVFCCASGSLINWHKSSGFLVGVDDVCTWGEHQGFTWVAPGQPCRYLGFHVGLEVSPRQQFEPVLASIRRKICHWAILHDARRLLLDPAIHAEFIRMKKDLESAEKKIKELQDDLGAVQFTPHSKNGKMLMAKCRTLQEENEEIGREASEGKIHELGTKLAMQKSLNTELKRGYQELYEYVEEVSEEAERSHELVNILQRQLERKEQMLLELQRQLEMFNNPKVVQEGQNQVETEDIVPEERVEGMETNEPAVKVERAE